MLRSGQQEWSLTWGSAEINVKSWTCDGIIPSRSTSWALAGWTVALLKRHRVSWQTARGTWASQVSWQQWQPTASWAELVRLLLVDEEMWFFYSAQHLLGHIWNTLPNFSLSSSRDIESLDMVQRGPRKLGKWRTLQLNELCLLRLQQGRLSVAKSNHCLPVPKR